MRNSHPTKALFLLHEGIGATIFNSQVAEHVEDMKKKNVVFDILTFETWNKSWNSSNCNLEKFEKAYPETTLVLKKGVNIFLPIINLYNAILLLRFLFYNRTRYSFIHARADYSAFIALITKPFHKIPVIWDCRGDSLNELNNSLSRKNPIMKLFGSLYLIPSMRIRIFVNTRFADKAIFVSDALKSLYIKDLKSQHFEVIPCPVAETKFFFDENLRHSKRKELSIKDDEFVFMYSGSMVGYQFTDGLRKIFEKIVMDKRNIILILTTEPAKARNNFNTLPLEKLLIFEAAFHEMVSFYNASDFGILLRENKRLNYVASPTKFGEYSLSGLPVIMNDTVAQCYNFSREIGNYISFEEREYKILSIRKRYEIAERSKNFYSRQALNQLYLNLYSSLTSQ